MEPANPLEIVVSPVGLHNESIEERSTACGREMIKVLQRVYAYEIDNDLIVYEDPDDEHNEHSRARRMPRVLEFFVNYND